jgi:ubiquinone/menaquinone biosynthesis C-methylase UbiE
MSIDEVKAYWDRRPCNVNHSSAEKGTKQYFDEVEARKYRVEPHIPAFAEFDLWQGKDVLEVGCGIGTDAVNFVRAGANYRGVDLSVESVAIASRRLCVYGLQATFTVCNAESLPTLQKFDLIYSFGVIHHTPDPLAALKECHRCLKDDGELRIMLYAKDSFKAAMIDAGLDQPEAQFGCPIAHTYTKAEATALLAEAGFQVKDISQDHIFPYQVDKYVKHEYVKEPWVDAMPPAQFRVLEKRFGWHLLIKATRA